MVDPRSSRRPPFAPPHACACRCARPCNCGRTRTTVELDPDTAKAVQELRRKRGIGVSEAVNELIRRALLPRPAPAPFRQRTHRLGLRVDVSNFADALEALDGADAR